ALRAFRPLGHQKKILVTRSAAGASARRAGNARQRGNVRSLAGRMRLMGKDYLEDAQRLEM
ncbi:MAG: hypothetical protein L0312_13455, partial [Acidobacteria bacterium]|nr:hypothetical protein [Acidobacteriota bacterium]